MKHILLAVLLPGLFTLTAETHRTEQLKSFLKNCSSMAEEPLDKKMEGSSFHWFFEGKYDIVFAHEKFYSFLADEMAYEGGANARRCITAGTILRSSKRQLTLKDIAPDRKSRERLLRAINKALLKYFKCSTQKELEKNLLSQPFLTKNFYLDGSSLHFVFNEYEIAGKGTGPINIAVPLKELPRLPEK